MRHRALDIEALTYLTMVAQVGKISRAAKIIGVEAARVSRKISAVENELGVTIFERGNFGARSTAAGEAVLVHVRRMMAELEAVKTSGKTGGTGQTGQIRLGLRMPPVGEPMKSLLQAWRKRFPKVELELHETRERDIAVAMEDRRLDLALMTRHTLWPRAASVPVYRERLLLALPEDHRLLRRRSINWGMLRYETFLVQGWEDSQTAREFFSSFLGSGVRYQSHAASKQSVLALVAAGYGATLVTKSQAEVGIPGVVIRPIAEKNAWVAVDLAWVPENEEPAVGRFVAFMRDEALSRKLV